MLLENYPSAGHLSAATDLKPEGACRLFSDLADHWIDPILSVDNFLLFRVSKNY